MYIWDESMGKRGSCEIASCLMHYIEKNIGPEVKTLHIFSDNCSGQNKNVNLVLTCLSYIHSTQFTTIEHTFMVSGHSYLPCDRDFGNIEQYLKKREIFTSIHYAKLIKICRKNNPFEVVIMTREEFRDVDILQSHTTKRKVKGAKFSEGKVFVFSDSYKMGFGVKTTYNMEVPHFVNLQKGRGKNYDPIQFDLSKVTLPNKYNKPVSISQEKLADIRELISYIPVSHHGYFNAIFAGQEDSHAQSSDTIEKDDDLLDY